MAKKPRVLFLCTGNSARSQIAEAILKKYAGEDLEVHSAGMTPKGVNPLTIKVMEEAGYDLEGHYSKDVSEYLGKMVFAYVIVVCDKAQGSCPAVFPLVANRLFWGFDDPAEAEGTEEERMQVFRRVRDEIEARILEWLNTTD